MEWQTDVGTAYDLWMSLHVLHHPSDFGLRRPWAAGVRARLPEPERQVLAEVTAAMPFPFPWVASLEGEKSAECALEALAALPAEKRLPALFILPETPPDAAEIWRRVAESGKWNDQDLKKLRSVYARFFAKKGRKFPIEDRLRLFANSAEIGEKYLQALKTYHRVFFAEEEERILPALENAANTAAELLENLGPEQALEKLTQGLNLPAALAMKRLILAPSYWSTPLIVFHRLSPDAGLLVFGARPQGDSLVPGEEIPTAVMRGLRALDNPTRLRILRYLAERPTSPSQLARRLRLRLPTVLHHLHVLRLAGLVSLNLSEGERLYSARREQLGKVWEVLQAFLQGEPRQGGKK